MDLGICVRDVAVDEAVRLGRFAEEHAFTHLFLPEAGQRTPDGQLGGRDPFVTLAAVFAATQHLEAAVGVSAAIFHHLPHLALAAATLTEQSAGRFLLGIGVSHREAAERFGLPFPQSPLGWIKDALAELRSYRDGRLRFGTGFPILVGALGPKMVALGATDADGVVLNWLTPATTQQCVAEVRNAAPPGNKALTVLYVRVAKADALRVDAVNYNAMANYRQHFLTQELHGPDQVTAGTCIASDDLGLVRDRLAQYAESGLDLLCLYPHGLDPAERERVLAAAAAAT